MKLIRKNKKGFTLVELIVVIAILAILALILIPAITGYIAKADQSRLDSSARALYSQAVLLAAEDETEDEIKTALGEEVDKAGKGDTVTLEYDDETKQVESVTITNGSKSATAPAEGEASGS